LELELEVLDFASAKAFASTDEATAEFAVEDRAMDLLLMLSCVWKRVDRGG
jgi:hypothetical protein